MSQWLQVMLYGAGMLVCGGGTVFLLLVLGERLGRWLSTQAGNDKNQ